MEGFADGAAELTARGSVVPGDHILAVAGTYIDGKGQDHLRELLRDAPDPVVLLLRRDAPSVAHRTSRRDDDDDENHESTSFVFLVTSSSVVASADSYGSGPAEAPILPDDDNAVGSEKRSSPPPNRGGYYGRPPYATTTATYYPVPAAAPVVAMAPPHYYGQPWGEPPVNYQHPSLRYQSYGRPTTSITGTTRPNTTTTTTTTALKHRASIAPMPPPQPQQMPSQQQQQKGGRGSAPPHRFGLGPLNVVLERARSDVDALVHAYEANAFTRWQLKIALQERLPTLDGKKPRVLKQGGAGPQRSESSDPLPAAGPPGASSAEGAPKQQQHPRALGSPEDKQRMLMLMLAHDITPGEICSNVLRRDKEVHLRRDKLVASQGYWVAISQERMRALYEANDRRRVYVYFDRDDVAPLPAKFTACGFERSRATMNIDRKSNGTTLRAQVQRVQYTFRSANHPHEPPLVVEYDLYHTKPYHDLLGVEEPRSSGSRQCAVRLTNNSSSSSIASVNGTMPPAGGGGDLPQNGSSSSLNGEKRTRKKRQPSDDDGELDEEDDDDSEDSVSGEEDQKKSRRKEKKARLTNGTLYPGGTKLDTLNQLATHALQQEEPPAAPEEAADDHLLDDDDAEVPPPAEAP